MKNFMDKVKAGVVASVVGVVGIAQNGFCVIDLTGVSVDTADYIAIATFLITALVAFWGIKKGLALLR